MAVKNICQNNREFHEDFVFLVNLRWAKIIKEIHFLFGFTFGTLITDIQIYVVEVEIHTVSYEINNSLPKVVDLDAVLEPM